MERFQLTGSSRQLYVRLIKGLSLVPQLVLQGYKCLLARGDNFLVLGMLVNTIFFQTRYAISFDFKLRQLRRDTRTKFFLCSSRFLDSF